MRPGVFSVPKVHLRSGTSILSCEILAGYENVLSDKNQEIPAHWVVDQAHKIERGIKILVLML